MLSNWGYAAHHIGVIEMKDKPGLTPKGEKMPSTVEEWEYLCNKYAELIDEKKAEIEGLVKELAAAVELAGLYKFRVEKKAKKIAELEHLVHIPKGG